MPPTEIADLITEMYQMKRFIDIERSTLSMFLLLLNTGWTNVNPVSLPDTIEIANLWAARLSALNRPIRKALAMVILRVLALETMRF